MRERARKAVRTLRAVREGRVWRSAHAALYLDHALRPGRRGGVDASDGDRLGAAADWLRRAQDATEDGGIAGRYHLGSGWSASYPETTGYLIPTFLRLEEEREDEDWRERTRRCVEFLLSVQMDNGAFSAGEVSAAPPEPSIFNTAQIVTGLTGWYRSSGDDRARRAALRAGDWLVESQDADGAWRRHVYGGTPVAYASHASCWLAELGVETGRQDFLDAAERNLDWTLDLQTPGGWFERSGFPDQHAARTTVTHTLGYTLWGLLRGGAILQREDAVAAVAHSAERLAERVETWGWLPAEIDHEFGARADHACVTGNCQLALVWFELHRRLHRPLCMRAGSRVLRLASRAQSITSRHPGIRGGLPGSDPVWGAYIPNGFPNWAAKYFIDALLTRRELMRREGPMPTNDS